MGLWGGYFVVYAGFGGFAVCQVSRFVHTFSEMSHMFILIPNKLYILNMNKQIASVQNMVAFNYKRKWKKSEARIVKKMHERVIKKLHDTIIMSELQNGPLSGYDVHQLHSQRTAASSAAAQSTASSTASNATNS